MKSMREALLALIDAAATAGHPPDPSELDAIIEAYEVPLGRLRVVRNAKGELRAGRGAIRLDLDSGELYQVRGTDADGNDTWKPAPGAAYIGAAGYRRLARASGVSVLMPATVQVDGQAERNPYLQRHPQPDGRPGDIVRVVVRIRLVGLGFATGQLAVVDYSLDYAPQVALAARLGQVLLDTPELSSAITFDRVDGVHAGPRCFVPLYLGVGYHALLTERVVQEEWRRFAVSQRDALQVAQSIAMRNAARLHPAFHAEVVQINADTGVATVPFTAWSGVGAQLDALADLAAGRTGARELESSVVVAHKAEVDDIEPSPSPTTAAAERTELCRQIDEALSHLSPSRADPYWGLYDPAVLNLEELRSLLTTIMEDSA